MNHGNHIGYKIVVIQVSEVNPFITRNIIIQNLIGDGHGIALGITVHGYADDMMCQVIIHAKRPVPYVKRLYGMDGYADLLPYFPR